MTITCILEDSGASEINKLAAHDGVFERVKPHIFEALKGRLEGRKVARIIAAGGKLLVAGDEVAIRTLGSHHQQQAGIMQD